MLSPALRFLAVCLMACMASLALAAAADKPVFTDASLADTDFALQGEYSGEALIDGQPLRLGIQVVALGDGAFDVVAYPGGLPGAGWSQPNKVVGKGTRTDRDGTPVVVLEGVDWSPDAGLLRTRRRRPGGRGPPHARLPPRRSSDQVATLARPVPARPSAASA